MKETGIPHASQSHGPSTAIKAHVYLGALLAVLLTLIVYAPALNNGFVNWDDGDYVYENTDIFALNLPSLKWMLTSFHATNWHPMTWLSHGVDYALWGLNPLGHHLTSMFLHGLNTLLLFLVILQLLLRRARQGGHAPVIAAMVTALLFGVHPLHVESAAWVSERKDLLCAFFMLLCTASYLAYTSSRAPREKRAWFAGTLVLFTLALMSKPMAVTLPVILILLDIYPLGRLEGLSARPWSVLLEKIPFFALSMASSLITILAQSGGAIRTLEQYPLQSRVLNAFRSVFLYIRKMAWPGDLVPFYPYPADIRWSSPQFLLPMAAVVALTCLCALMIRRRHYLIFTVWAYYLITLLPVIGIIQVGKQAAADRYTYLPSISLFLLGGLAASRVYEKVLPQQRRRAVAVLLVLALSAITAMLGYRTVKQIMLWRDSETLWKYVISVFPDSTTIPYNNLGHLYREEGRLSEAIASFEQALRIDAGYAPAHFNLGRTYHDQGRYDRAVYHYGEALRIDPNHVEAQNNLALTYYAMKRVEEAMAALERALSMDRNFPQTYYNLGFLHQKEGKLDEAIGYYRQALQVNPRYLDAEYNLANAYYDKRMIDEAIAGYEKVIDINPQYALAHNNLGNAYAAKRMLRESITAYQKALAINPRYGAAYNNLGSTYLELGMFREAIEVFKKALAISPDDPETNKNLSVAYYVHKEYKLAVMYCDKALKLGYPMQAQYLELLKPHR